MSVTTGQRRGLRVAELAARVGLSPDTIRYYERVGLLPAPGRTPSGYREYDDDAVDRLRFIQSTQRLGLPLKDIVDLLSVRDTGACSCQPAEELLRQRLSELDEHVAALTALRTQMAAMLDRLDRLPHLPLRTEHSSPTAGTAVTVPLTAPPC